MRAAGIGKAMRMPRNGPIPLNVHAMAEPVIGILFIVAPFVLGFDDSAARTLSIAIGAAILLVGMTTRWRLSLIKLIPLPVHFAGDILIGIVCIAGPFVLGFSDEAAALAFLVVLGMGELVATFSTAWRPADERPGERPRPGRYEPLSG